MTNDELKALCESNAKAIQALTNAAAEERQLRSTNTDEIDTLLGAVSSNEVACRELRQTVEVLVSAIGESNQRFDILRSEGIADRQRADVDRQRADVDRQNWQTNFEAQMEALRSQFIEMSRVNQRLDNLEQRAS